MNQTLLSIMTLSFCRSHQLKCGSSSAKERQTPLPDANPSCAIWVAQAFCAGSRHMLIGGESSLRARSLASSFSATPGLTAKQAYEVQFNAFLTPFCRSFTPDDKARPR
jgi:hypothetical protein